MKQIFKFSKSVCEWTGTPAEAKKVLGGKGAGLAMMSQNEMPVPPGFTITTEQCNIYRNAPVESTGMENGKDDFLGLLMEEVLENDQWLADQFGFAPLVSVRSGAPISMPGMMDTILNVGLTDVSMVEWQSRLGERAAWDSYRRLIQMLGSTAYGIDMGKFTFQLASIKKAWKVKADTELTVEALQQVVNRYKMVFEENAKIAFPQTREEQLAASIKAVFDSWMNERAIEYRRINKIDEDMGTAVNVQAMVFGNMGDDSGTGVLFSRNPSTGEPGMMGEFLQNAQGEDVVAGIRTPVNIEAMKTMFDHHAMQDGKLLPVWPEIYKQIEAVCATLEHVYRDMVDIEFTVQQGQLFILQSRTGKRSARAAFKIAVDQVKEGLIDKKTALSRLTAEQFKVVRRPNIDPKFEVEPNLIGLPACPGVAVGKPVFSSVDAINCKEPCILITHETTPEDIKGMDAAVGILTQTGGATSHAAVVARAMDKTCVVGCTSLDLMAIKQATKVTIDGSTGRVWIDTDVPVIDSSDAQELTTVTEWCLSVLGACEIAPVDFDMEKPHTVMAAYWWGSEDVLNAVLDGIADLPSRQHVTLDIRAPRQFMPAQDSGLQDCFGEQDTDSAFETIVRTTLIARALELGGLAIAGGEWMQEAAGLGYATAGAGSQVVAKAVPADYAAFVVLGR